jgi:hypothetical protein
MDTFFRSANATASIFFQEVVLDLGFVELDGSMDTHTQ